MPLKFSVDSLEDVAPELHSAYEEKDGKFVLAVEGAPKEKVIPEDYESLRESVAKLEKNNQELLKQKSDAKKAAEAAALEAAKKGGDIEAVEKSWIEKYQKLEAETGQTVQQLNGMVNNLTVGATGHSIASKLALEPQYIDVLMPHILQRLSMEMVNGKPTTRVLGKDGKPSALTLDELADELKGDARFAPIIVGSRAGGGGSAGDGDGSSGVIKVTLDKFNAMSPAEKADFARKKGEII